MSIISELSHKQPDSAERTYPWLGITREGKVVMFTSARQGLCLHDTCKRRLLDLGFSDVGDRGTHSTSWAEELFTPPQGTVTLSNG